MSESRIRAEQQREQWQRLANAYGLPPDRFKGWADEMSRMWGHYPVSVIRGAVTSYLASVDGGPVPPPAKLREFISDTRIDLEQHGVLPENSHLLKAAVQPALPAPTMATTDDRTSSLNLPFPPFPGPGDRRALMDWHRAGAMLVQRKRNALMAEARQREGIPPTQGVDEAVWKGRDRVTVQEILQELEHPTRPTGPLADTLAAYNQRGGGAVRVEWADGEVSTVRVNRPMEPTVEQREAAYKEGERLRDEGVKPYNDVDYARDEAARLRREQEEERRDRRGR